MSMLAALYSNGRCVTGNNHGEAAGKLKNVELDTCTSGFLDSDTGKFVANGIVIFMKIIVCVRHAEYEAPFLTINGLTQAKQTGDFLSQIDLANFYGFVSPLNRCQQTAAIIGAFTGLRFIADDGLTEQSEDETSPQFRQRVTHTLEQLPAHSVLVTHCDTIAEILDLTVGPVKDLQNILIPHASVTYIDQRKAVWVGYKIDE